MSVNWTHSIFRTASLTAASVLALSACNPQLTQSADVSATSEVSAASETPLMSDPALLTGMLDNGLRYFILENASPPGQGALRVQFDAGSLAEVESTKGLAHYLEHMAFNGSENVPEGEMIQMLERLGLSFGADTNASTGLKHTTYKLNLPKTTDEILDAAFMLMRETASNLTLDQDAIDRELGIILSEKRTRDTAIYRAWEARMRFGTSGSDVMDRLPIGTEETLRSIKDQDFRDYYNANYHPEKTIVVFVGDAEPAEIEARIQETFGDWEGVTDPAPTAVPSPADVESSRIVIHAEDGLAAQVTLSAQRPYLDRDDTVESRNDRTLRGLAFSILNYRLRSLSEQTDRAFVSANSGPNSTLELTEGAAMTAYIRPENWENALRVLDDELRKALEYGFDPVELENQIRRYDASYEALAEGADTRSTIARTGGLVGTLLNTVAEDNVFVHPEQELERWNAFKDEITVADINAAFRERWGNIEDISVFMQFSDAGDITTETVRSVLQESRSKPVAKPVAKAPLTFAYADHGEPGKIVSDMTVEDVDARLVTFDNNVVLAVKQTDFQDDRVFVRVEFGDGYLSSPERNEGLRRMSLSIMKESGLEEHSQEELRDIMAGRLVSTSSFFNRANGDSFILSNVTVPDDLRTQLDVFTAQLSAQAFSEDARLNHIDKLKAWYPRHDTTIQGVYSKSVERLIYDDERFGFENEAQFYTPTLEEIELWLRPQLETGPVRVTIVGDIETDDAVEMVAATLGALPNRQPIDTPESARVTEMRKVAFPDKTQDSYRLYHRGDANQSQLRIYWPASDGMDATNARRLSVLRAVLRNRMVTEIREGDATTYSPGAGSHASRVFDDFGYVVAVLTLKPEDIDAMSDRLLAIAADIASGNITPDEFDRARKPMVERLDSTEETNGYWMGILADAHGNGDGLDRHRTRRNDFDTMSLEDVRSLAKATLDNDRALKIRILPSELKG